MPELPDITVYIEALRRRIVGESIVEVRLNTPFLLRSVEPPLSDVIGKTVRGVERSGKRIVIALDDDYFVVLHLMIAGRLHWKARGAKGKGRGDLAAFEFPSGTLTLTEAGTKRRASLYLVHGAAGLTEFARGGLEVLDATVAQFAERLRSESHTVKRSLTDPRLFSGIGNAYSDEILHRARMSPVKLTGRLTDDEIATLFDATRATLHGKFGQPCPVCASPVQRIRYADNETNYCARCQTDGRLLADRGLSRLLKQDWPRSLDEIL
jgi:formamidopyrimidine-DNA glycosylase